MFVFQCVYNSIISEFILTEKIILYTVHPFTFVCIQFLWICKKILSRNPMKKREKEVTEMYRAI